MLSQTSSPCLCRQFSRNTEQSAFSLTRIDSKNVLFSNSVVKSHVLSELFGSKTCFAVFLSLSSKSRTMHVPLNSRC